MTRHSAICPLKPSLEGWKHEYRAQVFKNTLDALKPSLEGWKHVPDDLSCLHLSSLETFLRGMETSFLLPLICSENNLETFLRGMETPGERRGQEEV